MAGTGIARVTDCPVCLQTFKDPRVLPCGHTFCFVCIKEHGSRKALDPDCPNCRMKFQIPCNGFEGLAKNYALNLMLEKNTSLADHTSKDKVRTKRCCKRHNGEELILFCMQCNMVICLDCLEEDHQKHSYSKISRFAEEARTQLEGYVNSIKPILSQVTSKKAQLEEESKKFRELLNKTELAINEEYDKIKQLLDDHRRLLQEELSNEKQRVAKEMKMRTDEMEAEQLKLMSFNTHIEEMLKRADEGTSFDIVYQLKDFKDRFCKLKQIQPITTEQVNVTGISFIPADFNVFSSGRGNIIGRLQMKSDFVGSMHLPRDREPVESLANEDDFSSITIPDPFESATAHNVQNLDQDEMQDDDINVLLNKDGRSFRLEGDWSKVLKAIEQLEELKRKKHDKRNNTEENKDQTSNNSDAAKHKNERSHVLVKGLTPSIRQVDLSLSQSVPVDQHVWYYVEHKHQDKLQRIAQQNLCVSRVVSKSSNDGITYSFEVAPYAQGDSAEEISKRVDEAIEEFAQLYQKVSEPGIVKEIINLPAEANQSMLERLIGDLEQMGVFLLRNDNSCLIGPISCMEEAKKKVSDFTNGPKNSQVQMQPADNFGLAQASSVDRVGSWTFKTPSGLTVYVSQGDLVCQSLDAIVNPANERLAHGSDAARAISKAAGDVLQKECQQYLRKNRKLKTADVMHTSAGNLKPNIKYVIHTVVPRKSESNSTEELLGLVRLAVFNCLHYANDKLKIRSLAIPAISSGIFGVSIEIVGRASFEALTKFDEFCASSKKNSLREVHFVNNDEATFSNMKRIFQSLLTRESSVDPEQPISTTEVLDQYAEVFGRQRIETTQHESCFARAVSTALQRDFQSNLDWQEVDKMIRKELNTNTEFYKMFCDDEEPDKEWSLPNVFKIVDAFFGSPLPMNRYQEYDVDVQMNAAANALIVQIVLVHLSEKQEVVERNFKPRTTSENDGNTVYIAYYWCGHHHFDALVKKASLEENVPGKKMATSAEDIAAEAKHNGSISSHSQDNGFLHDFETLDKKEADDMPQTDKASDIAKVKAVKSDDNKKDDDDDDDHCIICMDNITDKKELQCKHKFCRECIDAYFAKGQPKCPSCGKVFGTLRGDQPTGNMEWRECKWQHLAGYNNCGSIEISYNFHDGMQGDNHPNPGQPYRGTSRTAYLPANKEGHEVLRLLKRAFDAGLVFTIGRSNTTGRDNVVIWNDVHHKTSPTGQYGYPDPTYLKRVKEELAAKGIQ